MKAFHLPLLILLIAYITACGKTASDHQLIRQFKTSGLNNPSQNLQKASKSLKNSPQSVLQTETKHTGHESLAETISWLRSETYLAAQENLKLVSEQYPEATPAVQSLLQSPDAAHSLFEGCFNYWRNLEDPEVLETQEWQYKSRLSYRQNFPEMAKYARIHSISPDKHLIIMPCWLGPYWEATAIYIYTEIEAEPQLKSLILPVYNTESSQITPGQSNINYGLLKYDPEKSTLALSHKYSGMGGCGFKSTYRLENDELFLIEFREQRDCNGTNRPREFPQVYP